MKYHPPLLLEVAEELEQLAVQQVHPRELLATLQRIPDAETLWALLPYLIPCIPVAQMVYRRALELGASEDRARGYLANTYSSFGDDETAGAITGQGMPQTDAPELLLAWASLDWTPEKHVERLQTVLPRIADPLPAWRGIASTAGRHGMDDLAAMAYRWLSVHEPDAEDRERIRGLMQERGWH